MTLETITCRDPAIGELSLPEIHHFYEGQIYSMSASVSHLQEPENIHDS